MGIDEQVAFYSGELERNWKGFEEDGLNGVADILDEKYLRDHDNQTTYDIPPRTDTTDQEKLAAVTIFKRVWVSGLLRMSGLMSSWRKQSTPCRLLMSVGVI